MYTYQYGGATGKTYQLVEAKDLVVVRTKSPEEEVAKNLTRSTQDAMAGLIAVAAFPEANVTIYRCVPTRSRGATQLRNEVRRVLKADDNIAFAGRVLKENSSGRIVVYTENFFVQFRDEVKRGTCRQLLKAAGLTIKENLPLGKNAFFAEAKTGTGLQVFEIAAQLLSHEEVQLCHPELVWERKHKSIYPMQWHLHKTKIGNRTINQHVDIETAWQTSKGEGMTIAIIDDGVDASHEEFRGANKVVFPRDTIRNVDDASPQRRSENHGTACAGVACANGKKKASGVAPAARLMPIRSGGLGSLAEAKAFIWAADNGADVISCSWGPADGYWGNPDDPFHQFRFDLPDSSRLAIDYAIRNGRGGKGCVITWAAGNGRENVGNDGYASYNRVIAVAACNDRGKRSVYSDFGEAIWCAFPSNDFAAPHLGQPQPLSAGIWTTDRRGRMGYNQGGFDAEEIYGDRQGTYTATFGGTSSACPGVAGVAALVLSVNPELHWQEVKQLLRLSCDQIDPQGGRYDVNGHSVFYGYGRLNAAKAVQKALTTTEEQTPEVKVMGHANFSKQGEVLLTDGQWVGADVRLNKLLGVQLELDVVSPDLQLSYDLRYTKQKTSGWIDGGTYAGHTDRRRKICGIRFRLTGAAAEAYDIVYRIEVYKRRNTVEARNGEWCAAGSQRIERLWLSITEKTS